MTPTPETDKALFSVLDGQADVVHADFARRLERERDEARGMLREWIETVQHADPGVYRDTIEDTLAILNCPNVPSNHHEE